MKRRATLHTISTLYRQGKNPIEIALAIGRSKRFVYRHLTAAMTA